MAIKSYVLFYPSIELGGAEILLSRLANKLAERGNSVTVLDSNNNVIIRELSNPNIKAVVVQYCSPVHVSCDYIIAFASHISNISKYIDATSQGKLLFWNIHPLNNIYLPPLIGTKLFQLGICWLRFINLFLFNSENNVRKLALLALLKESAFVCMDGENASIINKYYRVNNIYDFIPIPVYTDKYPTNYNNQLKKNVSLYWYGRLCDFKSHSLIYLIEKMSELQSSSDFVILTVIGDGPYRNLIERIAIKRGVKVLFVGTLPNYESLELLRKNATAVFAMGTSALESGALGIPTILAGASFGRINFNYRFNWLYNTSNYTLGVFAKKENKLNGMSFNELIYELFNNIDKHASQSREYVEKNHNIDHVVDLVEKHASLSKMDFKSFAVITKYKQPLLIRLAKYCKEKATLLRILRI
jgi:glycosyltransferase involved in cell wall biosynthesis